MEGAALRSSREVDMAMVVAWHTAMFALNGYAGKLKGKSLSDYLTSKPEQQSTQTAKAVKFFHGLKARGFDVSITRH